MATAQTHAPERHWPDKHAIYDLLSAGRRRIMLDVLDSAGPMSKDDLAHRVAAREGPGTATPHRAVLQYHLPVFVAHDVLAVDGPEVSLGPAAPVVLRVYRAAQKARVDHLSSA